MCTKMMAQNKFIGNRDYNYADDDAQRKLSNNINPTYLSTDLFLITELCIQDRQDNEANQTHNGKR